MWEINLETRFQLFLMTLKWRNNYLIVLVGESASGKSTIEKELISKHHFNKIVTYTTRPPRPGEVDGVDYHFVDKSQFRKLKGQDFFCETAVYNEWCYGTAKKDSKDDTIIIVTPHGLRQLKKDSDLHIISFYIKVPRRDRLIKALQRGDNLEEAYRRSLSDVGQFDGIEDEVDYVIENNGYKKNVDDLVEEILYYLE